MGIIRAGWNLTAMLVGLLVLPLGYMMVHKTIRGLLVSIAILVLFPLTAGVGSAILYLVALYDILTGGKVLKVA